MPNGLRPDLWIPALSHGPGESVQPACPDVLQGCCLSSQFYRDPLLARLFFSSLLYFFNVLF